MRAVTYEEHCKRCHALSLPPPWPGGPELVHDDMAHVRLQLAQQLKQLPLVSAQQAAENPSLLEQKTGRPPRQKIEKIPQAQWIQGKLSDLAAGIDKVLKRQEGLPPGWPARPWTRPAGSRRSAIRSPPNGASPRGRTGHPDPRLALLP